MKIKSGASLNITNGITNDGTLTLNGGTLDASVSELNTAGLGTVEITGDVAIGNGAISNNKIKLTSGSLDVTNIADSTGNVDLSTATEIIGGEAVLGVQDGLYGTINLGKVTASTSSPVKVAIDSNFSTLETDILSAADVTGAINIAKLYVTADPVSTEFSVQVADSSTMANVNITGMTVENLSASVKSLLYTYDNTSGYIKAVHSDLENAILSSVTQKAYVMNGDESIKGALDLGGTSLSVTGGGYTITSSNPSNNGITITDSSQILTIDNAKIGDSVNKFGTAIDNTTGGIINLNDITVLDNLTDVLNNGEGTKGVFLTGTNNIGTIVDTAQTGAQGQTTITSGTSTIGTLAQKDVTIGSSAVLNIKADNLITTSGTVNDGTINLQGGSLNSDIVNSSNDTTMGILNITDNTDILGTIIQKDINVSANKSLTNKNGSSTTVSTVNIKGGIFRLEKGSYTDVTSLTIDNDGSNKGTLSLVDNAVLTSTSKVKIVDGNLQLTSLSDNVTFNSEIETGSKYNIVADTSLTGGANKVTLDSDVSEALSIVAKDNTTIDLGKNAIDSLDKTKSIVVGNNGVVGLNATDTKTSTYADTEFVSNILGSKYTLNINNDGSNAKVGLNTVISGADAINILNGTAEINDNTVLNETPINLKADSTLGYDGDLSILAANTINLTSKITGDDESKNNVNIADLAGTTANAKVNVYSNIENARVNVNSGELWLSAPSNIADSSTVYIYDGAKFNAIDGALTNYGSNYTLNDGANIKIDAHLTKLATDNFSNANVGDNKVVIDGYNPINAQWIVHNSAVINLNEATGIKNLAYSDAALAQREVVMTPIRELQGYIVPEENVLQYVKTGDEYKNFNPAVFNSTIASQVGGYFTQLNSYNEAFSNMDMYTMMTKKQRNAIKYANKYAASNSDLIFTPLSNPNLDGAVWFRPYTSFESVGLKRGPRVSNVAYGTFAGFESGLTDLSKGWEADYGIYAGYNGSHQAYQGNSMYQNGATLGLVGMAYKNDFFIGSTINVSDNVGDASNMYGKEDFNMLMSGAAVKSGYNYELADGKFVIQPSFQASYSFVNTFDYKNSARVKIKSDPLHAIQLEPQIKLIGNLSHGWQPYAHLSGVWNILDKTEVRANDVSLPSLSVKPYARYGIGVRKTFGDRVSGFFQTFFTSGGRNGMGLQFGFKIRLGEGQKRPSMKHQYLQPTANGVQRNINKA